MIQTTYTPELTDFPDSNLYCPIEVALPDRARRASNVHLDKMFRRSPNLRKLFGDYVSPERIENILKGPFPAEAQPTRTLDFVWIWLTEEQVTGPEIGSAIDLASSSGGLIEIFPPVAAFWFGLFDEGIEPDISKLVQALMQLTANGAKLISGTASGSPENIGSHTRMSYSVLSPDRAAILSQLAVAAGGSMNTFETKANTERQAAASPSPAP